MHTCVLISRCFTVRRRSPTPTPRNEEGRIDKKKLLEIAKRNAKAMMQLGSMQQIRQMTADELASLKAGGRSLEELTGQFDAMCLYCTMLEFILLCSVLHQVIEEGAKEAGKGAWRGVLRFRSELGRQRP